MTRQHEELNKKIRVFERIMWGVAGVGSVMVFIISQFRSLKAILGIE